VSDVPTLSEEERREQLGLLRRLLPRWVHGESMELKLVSSILVGRRRYDTWWSKEILERGRPRPEQEIRPLLTFVFQVRAKDMEYRSIYLGPPFPAEGIEDLPPGRAAEQLAVVDSFAYDGRQLALEVYRRRAAARPGRPAPQYELAVMIWFHHFTGSPGPVEEAEPTLRRALELKPRAHAYHGLLGEILLRAGRERQALQAFGEAARLRPDHPRYHYCASVAYEAVGDAVAAKRALTRAKRVAGPKLQERFTRASNPLEDYRYSLLCEAGRLRERHEGLLRRSDREIAERFRTENTIRRSEVPRDLQELVPLAEKWGIGDEPSREYFVRRATREEKEELRRAFRLHGRRISEWLDSLSPDRLSPESGAFLYLLEACEEMGPR
jgi:tetratricopeptide (TPR) repeat protein